ncbi:D-alanine--D-alanine ligase [Longimonas halophila]|uniref:D-alanine--D-alanine ligase n=1 Tax=Longimonas halophila TaxID=1469170 RepID=A0A2H3NKU1_9BACT|nr:D-alanine--D-alanine ligase [Longimonas halophila]PEN06469.1 D-alanine--D-alanine ligase [Longimonas halophila]
MAPPPRVGLIYDVFSDYTWSNEDPPDADAEFEPIETVDVLEEALRQCGAEPVRVGPARALQDRLCTGLALDAALTIAEGQGTRNREAHAPILLELAGIPQWGSDALTLSLTLDKATTKDLAVRAGVKTPPWTVFSGADAANKDALPAPFPLFVKPRYEGTSKGIMPVSKVNTLDALRDEVNRQTALYRQDVIVEAFIEGGGEFTVAVVGNDPPRALPVLQRAVEPTTGIGVHALERRGAPDREWDYTIAGTLSESLETRLCRDALRLYQKLECRDVARLDFRVDADGTPYFLEINPLPTFAPDGTFAIIAELMNRLYPDLLADVIAAGLKRLGVYPLANRDPLSSGISLAEL